MTPNFSILRALHARIAAKPEALVRLNWFRYAPVDCGTPYCVAGELIEMPEARAIGWRWASDFDGRQSPRFFNSRGYDVIIDSAEGGATFGLSEDEAHELFVGRKREDIPEKAEALARIEKLFAYHAEPLHLPDSIEYARRDEVVA